ncbi:MAG: hypothetical protein AMXMBFR64_33360 [Myxococcales bacterium]
MTLPLAARALLDLGVPRSAAALLASTSDRGHEIGALRSQAYKRRMRRLAAGFYGVVVHADVGLVLPLHVERGVARGARDDASLAASQRLANQHARALFSDSSRLPSLIVRLPEDLGIQGSSLGLASFLAFVARLAGIEPRQPIAALGDLCSGDTVGSVGRDGPKLAAISRDLTGQDGLVLVTPEDSSAIPRDIRTIQIETLGDALRAVFGRTKFRAAFEVVSLEDMLRTCRRETDSERVVKHLGGIRTDTLPVADQAEVLMLLGTHMRHLGRTDEARSCHEEAATLLEEAEPALGAAHIEDLRMECLATEVDRFELEDLESRLRARLAEPFATLHNRVRCAGMLSQVVSMRGRPDEALRIREPNLEIQTRHAGMRDEIPWTLCALVLEAARARKTEAFRRFGVRLLEETSAGDAHQEGFNTAALSRGLALLDPAALVAWADGGDLWSHAAPLHLQALASGHPVDGNPGLSTARALVRALRVNGQPHRAVAVARSVALPAHPLARWVGALALIEGALAAAESGTDPLPLWTAGRRTLESAHPAAARFHAELGMLDAAPPAREADVAALESHIDHVWY